MMVYEFVYLPAWASEMEPETLSEKIRIQLWFAYLYVDRGMQYKSRIRANKSFFEYRNFYTPICLSYLRLSANKHKSAKEM